jgi:hypothetical protein
MARSRAPHCSQQENLMLDNLELPATQDKRPKPLALTIDDALVDIRRIDAFLAKAMPIINEAHAARQDRMVVVQEYMTTTGSKSYNGDDCFASYDKVGRIGPEVRSPNLLRDELIALKRADGNAPLIPLSFIDKAIPVVQPPPVVKPNVTKLRKLADFGNEVAALLKRYIVDGEDVVKLEVHPLVTDVTPRDAKLV